MASEHFHDLTWDYLYGLLDQTEAESLRAHMEKCAECRSALAEAEGQQQMLARAARVIQEVPAFTLPGQDQESAAAETTAQDVPPSPTPALPVTSPRRSGLRRYWPVWAAAAALLGIALGINELYQDELARHEARAAKINKEVETADGLFALLQANVADEKHDRARLLMEQAPPQLNVLAPAQVHADTPANIRVATRDQDGKPRAAEITTSIVEPASGLVLQKQVDRIEGEGTVQVPGLPTGTRARLQVEAKAGKGDAKVEESLQVAEPVHASHLALNKSTYYIGENLFFRTLTLDRFSLKPPAVPVNLRFTLVDTGGRIVREMPGQTGPGGISGGEWALDTDLAGGKYTLKVTAPDGADAHILPQQRALEIVRGESPQIAFDRNQYKPGDTINFNFRGGGMPGNNSYANKDVNITVNADGQPAPQAALNEAAKQAGAQNSARLDNEGNLNNYQLQLPPQTKNRAELVIDVKDGKQDNKLIQAIPVVSSERTIDFFPEGGDLVAGLPNRVYYRVRSPQGEPVDTDGHVILLAGKKVVYDSERLRGLGSFTFTPDPKETYSVRITGSQGTTELQKPFEKLGIQTRGLILHAPQSVVREGEPLTLVLRLQGAGGRLLLQTTCRGQIVDQQYLDLQPGSHAVKLQPAPGAAGVLRVTVLDASAGRLVPVAERLLYRVPDKWLDVSCQIANGAGPYAAGSKDMAMNLKVVDE
ncbi:MAG TPA: zf-HC2 domain-containing protein, partial [Gemmataceae bacterium]|nr:zf-HC2 domain-containing protein [Gemmataceae bacterium]